MTLTTGSINSLDSLIPENARDVLQRQNWQEFQIDIDKRLLIFRDDWKDQLALHIKKSLSDETIKQFFRSDGIKWPLPIHVNLLKRTVTDTSQVYSDTAKRSFEKQIVEEETETETIGRIESDERYGEIVANLNPKMQLVNKLVNVCNVVLVRPVPDPEKTHSQTGFRFDILTPDLFTPIQHPDNPSTIIGIMYAIDLTDTPGDSITNIAGYATRKEILFYMGTGEPGDEPFFAETDNKSNEPAKIQPYVWRDRNGKPYLPFAIFRSEEPLTGEFVNRTLGEDLVEGTLETGKLLSRWIRSYEASSAGKQLVISGPGSERTPKSIIRDILSIISFPVSKDDAVLDQIDHTVDVNKMWDALQKFIESVISPYGLSIEKFTAQAQSGISIKLKNEQLITRIKNQYSLYREGEKQLAEYIRRENNRALKIGEFGTIDEEASFQIDFGDLPFGPDPMEKAQENELYINMGLKSKASVLMDIEPDIQTEDEAQEKLKQISKMNREVKTGSLAVTAVEQIPPVEEKTEPVPNLLTEEYISQEVDRLEEQEGI
jgi:hypothetical protein